MCLRVRFLVIVPQILLVPADHVREIAWLTAGPGICCAVGKRVVTPVTQSLDDCALQ
jgi:hypothetical protein